MRGVSAASPLRHRLAALHETFIFERPPGAEEDVHMLASVVDHVIERCSDPGDVVLDPFAGFGTTLVRALALGRVPLGVELLPERVEFVRKRVPGARVVEGDARELLRVLDKAAPQHRPGSVELVLTSPPYMTRVGEDADPLTAYEKGDADYGRFLGELGLVAAQCAQVVAPGGFVVWNVANIRDGGITTHLIADCTRVLERHLTRVGVTEVVWDRYPHDLVSDALLVFRRAP